VSGAPSLTRIERRPDWAALGVGVFLIVVAAIVAYDAATLRSGAATYARIGPAAFPYGIAAGLGALGIATAVTAFRHAPPPRDTIELAPVLWILAGLVIQIALLPIAGFSIASGAVFAFTARAFGRGPLAVTYAIGAVAALAIWLAFAMGLKLVLPGGPLERWAQTALEMLIDLIRNGLS
jgi:putative tricarboxylic transport membrane protein